jgi:hypothetical protein
MVNQNTPMTGTILLCIPLSPAPSSRTPKMAECLFCLFPWHVLNHVINLLSLPSPCLFTFIWRLGAGGWTCHMESQEFGLWVQDSSFRNNQIITRVLEESIPRFLCPSEDGAWCTSETHKRQWGHPVSNVLILVKIEPGLFKICFFKWQNVLFLYYVWL